MAITPGDYIKAQAMAMTIGNMIGSTPAVVNVDGQYLEIQFTDAQKRAFIEYLDRAVRPLWSNEPRPAPTVQVRWGDVLVPWSVKYLAPAILAVFAAGYLTNAVFDPRGQ